MTSKREKLSRIGTRVMDAAAQAREDLSDKNALEILKAMGQIRGANLLIAGGIIWTVAHLFRKSRAPETDNENRVLVSHDLLSSGQNWTTFRTLYGADLAAADYNVEGKEDQILGGAEIGECPSAGDTIYVVGFHGGVPFKFENVVVSSGQDSDGHENDIFITQMSGDDVHYRYQVGMSGSVAMNEDGEVVGLLSREFGDHTFGRNIEIDESFGPAQRVVFFAIKPYLDKLARERASSQS